MTKTKELPVVMPITEWMQLPDHKKGLRDQELTVKIGLYWRQVILLV